MDTAQIILAVTPFLIELILVVRMFRSKVIRQYPTFFTFVAFDMLRTLVTLPLWRMAHAHYAPYFWGSWIGEAISIGLGFAVLWELFRNTFREYEGLKSLGAVLFRWSIVVLLLVAVVLAVSTPGTDQYRIVAAIMLLERSVRMIQTGLLLLLILFRSQLALDWRHPLFGIAAGFAIYAVVQVVNYAVRSEFGQLDNLPFQLLGPFSYLLATFVWLAYFWAAEKARVDVNVAPYSELAKWNDALAEVLHR